MAEPRLKLGRVQGSSWLFPTDLHLTAKYIATHKFCIGTTGTGKSWLLKAIVWQLLRQGINFSLWDPHGDAIDELLELLIAFGYFDDPEAFDRFRLYEFSDDEEASAPPFNFLRRNLPPHVIAANTLEAFHRTFPELAQGAGNFDTLILAGVEALVRKGLPLPALSVLLTNEAVRNEILEDAGAETAAIFMNWFERLSRHDQADAVGSTLKRVFMLTQNPALGNSLGQPENGLDAAEVIDRDITVCFNLRGIRSLTARRYLGSLLLIDYEEAALNRVGGSSRRQHHVIIDEAAQFTSKNPEPMMVMLSETRKRGLFVNMFQQSWAQSDPRLQAALQNVGTLICMRTGPQDAAIMGPWLGAGTFDPMLVKEEAPTEGSHALYLSLAEQRQAWNDRLINLPNRRAIVKLFDRPAVEITTTEVPKPRVDPDRVRAIKDYYRQRLMVPAQELDLIHKRLQANKGRTTRR